MVTMTIVQWRAYGADDDVMTLDVHDVQEGDDGDAVEQRIAEEQELRYDPDAEDMGSERGDMIVIDTIILRDGHDFHTPDGKIWRLNFEEIA